MNYGPLSSWKYRKCRIVYFSNIVFVLEGSFIQNFITSRPLNRNTFSNPCESCKEVKSNHIKKLYFTNIQKIPTYLLPNRKQQFAVGRSFKITSHSESKFFVMVTFQILLHSILHF